ncbi:MAG: phosphoadenylyl-sulfate reductase [Bacteroidales bacterium]
MQKTAEHFNGLLQGKNPEEVLTFFSENYPGKAVFSSSMGAEDQVITHMIATLGLDIRIFTLDTGRMFAETYECIQKTQARYKVPIEIYFPDARQVEEMVNTLGINLFYQSIENRKLCCNIRKIQPLERALKGNQVWITGLRRQQSPTREELQVAQWLDQYQMIKVNPLIDWSQEQLWSFIRRNKIPYNTLHDKDYASIGCQPCTRALLPGEDIRAGRWSWENPDSRECGLHVDKK